MEAQTNEELDDRALYREEFRAYMLMHGWISDQENMLTGIRYNRARKEFSHRWSAHSFGRMFGVREYNELLPLKDFLEMPILVIEDILEGVAAGTTAIKKAREDAKSPQDKRELDPSYAFAKELNQLKGKT